jgi:alpha-L-fucosidase
MNKLAILFGMLFLIMSCTQKSKKPEKSEETLEQDARMAWWREARFGMFIHWGLYADPAGEWKGKQIQGISEWIMKRAEIPVKDYEKIAETFNPEKYDAKAWVKLAKMAGMKYIVITSKHHDGFAMFHSKASQYNIYDATPFKRDPLKELADECKEQGIRLGFYYSQAQDWHEPGGTYPGIDNGATHWDPDLPRDSLINYINGKALPQVKEILENYGGLDILWWDTPIGMTEEAAQLLKNEADKYPDLITNNRLYRPWPGDFSTPEQYVPPTGLDYDWEVCMTMNTSWGYKWYDNNWKSTKTLIHMLVDIASKGGNLLLNVGPTDEGLIPDSSVVRLKQMGIWMQQNSESIYGTSASPFFKLPWGRCTQKVVDGNTLLYLHVFNWPTNEYLRVPGLNATIKDVYLLSKPQQKFAWKFEGGDALIHTPAVIFDPISTVIVAKIKGKPEITSNIPALKNGTILLTADFADIYNPGYGEHAVLKGSGKMSTIKNWSDPRTKLEWIFQATELGLYKIEALIKTENDCRLTVEIDEQKISSEIQSTGERFNVISLGEIQISETGSKLIKVLPVKENWNEIELMYVELIKKKGA